MLPRRSFPLLPLLAVAFVLAGFTLSADQPHPGRQAMAKVAHLEFRSPEAATTVSIGADFNDWAGSAKGRFDPSPCRMTAKGDGLFVFSLAGVAPGRHEYKFIVDGHWEAGPNRVFILDEKGHLTDPTGGISSVVMENPGMIRVTFSALLRLPKFLDKESFTLRPHGTVLGLTRRDGVRGEGDTIELHCRDLSIMEDLRLEVKGITDKPIVRPVQPDGVFRIAFHSEKPLGPRVEGNPPATVFRVFAPRARQVVLLQFSDPGKERVLTTVNGLKDADGVWEMRLPGTHWGTFYGFRVDGPHGEGEGFNFHKVWPDPWGRASVYHEGPSILIDPQAQGNGFHGWNDADFRIPARSDLVIYECSVRDLTAHSSSKVSPELRGKYLGLASTVGSGVGIDHIKSLGANAVEFLPVFEFDDDPPGTYHWGYMPSLFFTPEGSYARNPMGGQLNEFKALVDTLHRQGIAVLLDVVYNHTGAPQTLMGFDKKYFFRHDKDYVLSNFSGCGNDFKSENPMARKLILDSLEYWVREFHIDGFRFDLAELIDHETLLAIESRLLPIKPDVVLIAEPWSFRGNNKGRLKGTSWTSWNDDFRNRVKEASIGKGSADSLFPVLKGSVDLWAGHPLESVNYVESHDDFTLIDHLTHRADHNGAKASEHDIKRDLFCAAATLLSPGIPMIAQGQEMLRSKHGNHNSYNAGDQVNAVDYGLREKNSHAYQFYRDLITLRRSEAGRLIREAGTRECQQVERINGSRGGGLGLLWKTGEPPSGSLLVLFNAESAAKSAFRVKLPRGVWVRVFGEGRYCPPDDLRRREMLVSHADDDGVSLEVPALGAEVWMLRKAPVIRR